VILRRFGARTPPWLHHFEGRITCIPLNPTSEKDSAASLSGPGATAAMESVPPRTSGAFVSNRGRRLDSLDVVRGLVVVLMAVDHSSGAFNAGRVFSDGAFMFVPGTPLPAAQFLTRWITHLCAPGFVFLAGTSLALSIARRESRGESGLSIDRHLVTRGLLIAALELWPSYFWMPPGVVLFQVLYAIGASMVLMAALRRLPLAVLFGIAASILLGGEALTRVLGWVPPAPAPLLAQLFLTPGRQPHLVVAYPALPWLAIMILGWLTGHWLLSRRTEASIRKALLASAAVLLAVFAALRGWNGYGNMFLLRESSSLVQWLHVSKYPPSLTYVALELGVLALFLALSFGPAARRPSPKHPLLVFGRTPMFFYLLHIPILHWLAHGLGVAGKLGLGATYGFAALVVVALYPVCAAYGRYKEAHPGGLTRYL
jgi:uncharacterized membrane protein